MRTETFECTGSGGVRLPAVLWLPQEEPRKLVRIVHGMTEHIGRYEGLAEVLTRHGIAVAGFDLRGHGRHPGSREVASFGEGGWEAALEDMRCFAQQLSDRFADVPACWLGFSLGSFLLRDYLGRWQDDAADAVIMGTGHQPAAVLCVIKAIVRGQIRKAGFDQTTPLVRQLSFGTYNQKCKPNRTPMDWLCADEAQLDAYLADPLCRRDISAGQFWQLLDAMQRTGAKNACQNWNKALRVLLLSGQEDPVGDGGKDVLAVKKQLEKAGLADVTAVLLPGARHAVLQEARSGAAEKAMQTLCDWLLK